MPVESSAIKLTKPRRNNPSHIISYLSTRSVFGTPKNRLHQVNDKVNQMLDVASKLEDTLSRQLVALDEFFRVDSAYFRDPSAAFESRMQIHLESIDRSHSCLRKLREDITRLRKVLNGYPRDVRHYFHPAFRNHSPKCATYAALQQTPVANSISFTHTARNSHETERHSHFQLQAICLHSHCGKPRQLILMALPGIVATHVSNCSYSSRSSSVRPCSAFSQPSCRGHRTCPHS